MASNLFGDEAYRAALCFPREDFTRPAAAEGAFAVRLEGRAEAWPPVRTDVLDAAFLAL